MLEFRSWQPVPNDAGQDRQVHRLIVATMATQNVKVATEKPACMKNFMLARYMLLQSKYFLDA